MRPAALRRAKWRSQAEGGFGRPRDLAVAADQGRRFHHTRARCRACRPRPEGRLPLGVGLRTCREAQLQKKAWWLANAIVPTWHGGEPSGQSTKVASKLSGWSSSTRPGPGQTWRPCGDGPLAGTDSPPRFLTAAGKMTFLAALRHDRIDAPWFIEGPIDGVSFQV